MNLKQGKVRGRTYLSIVHGFWDPDVGHVRTKTIESLGYLDELQKTYPDPISHFQEVARQMTEAENNQRKVSITLDMNELLQANTDDHSNLGYAAILKVYQSLGLQKFFNSAQRRRNFEYNVNAVVTLLVVSRLLSPGSKKRAFDEKDRYFERFDFSLDDIYSALSFLASISKDVQRQMNTALTEASPRDTSLIYYDVTNFYFEIDEEDDLRKRGISKEKRRDPIVQMGLAMDRDGIPLHYELFEGNTNDTLTFRPIIGEIRRNYDTSRIIVVADRGITSGDNIYYLVGGEKKPVADNGYIFSYSIAGSTETFKKYVLDEKGYYDPSGKPISETTEFMIKSQKSARSILVTMKDGSKERKTIYEKQIVFWSLRHYKKMRLEREKQIEKAVEMLRDPSKLKRATAYGAARYIRNITFNKDTGEVMETGKVASLDTSRIEQEAVYDGYYAIVTSEFEMPDTQVVDHYRGLWEIEETFRITKGTLETRPVFVKRRDRIEAHFLTCFIALVVLRLIQRETGWKYSSDVITETLNKISCIREQDNIYLFGYRSQASDDIGKALSVDFTRKHMRLSEIKNLIKNCKKADGNSDTSDTPVELKDIVPTTGRRTRKTSSSKGEKK